MTDRRQDATMSDTRTHDLKSWPNYFTATVDGSRAFELRKNDRNFHIGDRIRLREWRPGASEYTGRVLRVIITSLEEGTGVEPGYCIMGIQPIKEEL